MDGRKPNRFLGKLDNNFDSQWFRTERNAQTAVIAISTGFVWNHWQPDDWLVVVMGLTRTGSSAT